MTIVYLILAFIVGFLLGRIRNPGGVMHIDTSDPKKDVYTLELLIPIEKLPDRKGVYFTIERSRDKHAL